jgi:hypothetical protein
MKKLIISVLLVLFFFNINAQNFEQFFIDKSLKIEYYHIGKKGEEKIEINKFYKGGKWSGTRSQLIEPHRYGDMLMEVFDSVSNTLIYSRSYSCLFGEYIATDKADTLEGSFEEVLLIPYPKNTIFFKITSYNRKQVSTSVYSAYYNPQLTNTFSYTTQYKVKKLHKGGDPKECVDILFIPDGYSEKDKMKLMYDFKRFASYITNCSPYSENLDHININGIEAYSKESGITDPNANVYKNTLLNCSFNTIDLDRYLMCLNVFKLHNIAEDSPYDVIVIICNSAKYGGGGIYNFYCTVNNDGEYSDYVIIHELGHLFAGLGDEYFSSDVSVRDYYPEGIEPIEPNLTTLVAFDKKWKNEMDEETPIPTPDTKQYNKILGVYEGGGYVAKGVYRPWQNCSMKEKLYNNFCPVCTKIILETIQYYSK